MRTETFKGLLWGTAERMGLDPTTADLSPEQARSLASFLQTRMREALEHAWWPEWTRLEKRQYRAAWSASTTYAEGDEVWHEDTGAYWTATAASTGEAPADGSSYWEKATSLNKYVAYEQTGKTVIDAVRAVYERDPRLTRRPATVDFWRSEDGVQVDPLAPNEVWLAFRGKAPRYTGTEWSALADYVTGDVVYVASSGQCYVALQASTTKDPTTETAYWEEQAVPYVVYEAVKELAYADLLREDGQHEKARVQESIARDRLSNMELVEVNQQDQADAARWRAM